MKKEKNESKLDVMRHSAAHVMAAAVKQLYGDQVKFAIGPTIEDGFYYDFDLGKQTISEDDLPKIEKKMKHIIKQNLNFIQEDVTINEALTKMKDQPYKLELIKELGTEKDKKTVTFYKLGDIFEDLCSGPHVESTNKIGPFKLMKVAGAYWRGDENNKMLQRIYGTAFQSKEELEEYLNLLKAAAERDHRKIGKELDLFVFSDLVGPGLPLFTPRGVAIIDELKKYIEEVCHSYGFKKVMTPHLAKLDLYKISGHADKFADELFHVTSKSGHDFVLKPVQCPHQTQIYASKIRSYRDLPVRYMESEKQYRAEKAGEIGGLGRVYAITVEDGHSFCRVDQVKEEVKNMINIIKDFYDVLGLWGSHWVSLSVRDYSDFSKYIGIEEDWDKCEQMLQEVSDEMGLDAKKIEGEAALYGPKLDFMFKDAIGKEIQIPTVQVDFATPQRFELAFTNEKGENINPVMVHRAILGSYERFLVLLIEHFAGIFPLWLSPVQVKLLPVSDKFLDYTKEVQAKLDKENIRVELDDSSETLGKKIRKGEQEKIPYLLIIGEKEVKDNKVAVRQRSKGDLGGKQVDDFINEIKQEIEDKIID
ncbi:MAG: threonine--tRNA ligase [Candidatus Buchananbacteria bacterium]|nr:threonine--tRNA ligase [Candidatus Buchananbacteria bacterium]